jgi:hypothetical protein
VAKHGSDNTTVSTLKGRGVLHE